MVMIVVMGSSAVPGSSRTLLAIAAANAARQQLREIDFGGTKLCRCFRRSCSIAKISLFCFPPLLSFLLPILSTNHNTGSVASKRACDGI
jgi:hypothetical protein